MSVAPADCERAVDALRFRRRAASSSPAAAASLGGRRVGSGEAAMPAPLLLGPASSVLDEWLTDRPAVERSRGCVRYATDGRWLHGVAELDDRASGLEAATQCANAELFDVLAASDCPNLLRLWNYFADINLETDGRERYRQFNAGRQRAFVDARRSAFEGAPAACALGLRGGPLRIHFLAGRRPPMAIENPRQVSAYRYPETYGPRSPTFSRAALAEIGGGRAVLFISGTASIVGHASVHAGDVKRQTEESLVNIAALRQAAVEKAAVAFPAEQLVCTLYLRHANDLAAVREVFERSVGADSPAARDAVYLQADICRSDLLVEIEAHGFACRPEVL